jgi:hypothetical protein
VVDHVAKLLLGGGAAAIGLFALVEPAFDERPGEPLAVGGAQGECADLAGCGGRFVA